MATPTPTPGAITLSVRAYKVKGNKTTDLTWTSASGTNVDLYQNGGSWSTTANDGIHTDAIGGKGTGTYTYKVCQAGSTTICSPTVTVSF